MSKQKVLSVYCDRCGHRQDLPEMKSSLEVVETFKYESLSKDWGMVRVGGETFDLCPRCNGAFKSGFDDFMRRGMMETGGPLG